MASYTETVEARNPALTATGLAIWGWILRVVVFVSFLLLPLVVNSVTPLVNYGATTAAYATQYQSQLAFAQSHPQIVAAAQKYKVQLAEAPKFAPELAVIQAHPALFTQLATYSNPAQIPPKLQAPGGRGRGRRRPGRGRADHDRHEQGRDQLGHRGRSAAAADRAVRGPADRAVQGAAGCFAYLTRTGRR